MKTVLSFGMGVESSSLLVYWTENSSRLDFDLTEDLIVVTAMTGGEYIDTKIQVEKLRLFGNCCESPQHLVVNSISRRNHGFNGLRRIRTDQSVKIRFDPSNPWFLLLFLNRKMLGCLTAIPKEPK
ncbi:MAG: hypothetical protein ACREEM_39285, partial [Blastocatellia bacterium]